MNFEMIPCLIACNQQGRGKIYSSSLSYNINTDVREQGPSLVRKKKEQYSVEVKTEDGTASEKIIYYLL